MFFFYFINISIELLLLVFLLELTTSIRVIAISLSIVINSKLLTKAYVIFLINNCSDLSQKNFSSLHQLLLALLTNIKNLLAII